MFAVGTQYIVSHFLASKIIITIYCARVKGVSQDIEHIWFFRQDAQKSAETFVDFSFREGLDKGRRWQGFVMFVFAVLFSISFLCNIQLPPTLFRSVEVWVILAGEPEFVYIYYGQFPLSRFSINSYKIFKYSNGN